MTELPPIAEGQASGVDVTLIDEFLALSPTERLRHNEEASRAVLALAAAWEAAVSEGSDAGPVRAR